MCLLAPNIVEAMLMFMAWSAKSNRQTQQWREGGGEERLLIVKQSLQISIELYNCCQSSFFSYLMKLSEYFNLYNFKNNSTERQQDQVTCTSHENKYSLNGAKRLKTHVK